ncbi:class I SAM-dependent methyltransferase [Nocardia asteroides]
MSDTTSDTAVKSKYRQLYDQISIYLNAGGGDASYFLNYGYRGLGGPDEARFTVRDGVPGADSVRLVYELIGPVDLDGRRVVDVGCGRGGPAALLAVEFGARVTGIDLSPEAVAYCRRRHRDVPVSFEVGDAEALGSDSGSVDVVTNLESSHTYPNMANFLSEVRRVLCAGGWFLHADMLSADRWREVRETVRRLGFTIESERDITANVLASRDAMAENRGDAPERRHPILANLLGLPGSTVYDLMESNACEYRIMRSRLPGISS